MTFDNSGHGKKKVKAPMFSIALSQFCDLSVNSYVGGRPHFSHMPYLRYFPEFRLQNSG